MGLRGRKARGGGAGEVVLHLHRACPVGGEFEGGGGILHRVGRADQGAHVDRAGGDQRGGFGEFGVEAETADQAQLLGDHGVHRHVERPADADLHDAAARAHAGDRLGQRARVARTLDGKVEATLVLLVGGQSPGVGGDVVRRRRAEASGQCQRGIDDVGDHHRGGTLVPQRQQHDAADRAEAGDQHARPLHRAGLRHGVQRDGKRLAHRRLAHRDEVADRHALPRLGDQPPAEAALNVRHAHRAAPEAHVQAVLRLALPAIMAGAAGVAGVDRDALADGQAADATAQRLDRAGELVAQHHRLLHPYGAEASIEEVMQIGAADAAGADPHRHLARAGGGERIGFDAQVVRAVQDAGFRRRGHRSSSGPVSRADR